MKRILLLVVLCALAGAAYFFWPHPPAAGGANQDARPLTSAEQAAFLPLLCGGASAGSGGYAHDCTSLPGYPSADYGGAGTGLGMTLTSIVSIAGGQAYVSYQGSFESHATDFGGGVLFAAEGKGGWRLEKWVPGVIMDGCMALTPQGPARMLCVRGDTGQGESISVLGIWMPGSTDLSKILSATDLRETMTPEANCALRTGPGQDVLLSIDNVSRSGSGFAAQIEYVPAAVAQAACKAQNFAAAPVTKRTLALSWDGSSISLAPGSHFAPASE